MRQTAFITLIFFSGEILPTAKMKILNKKFLKKVLSTILKEVDNFASIAQTSTSVTIPVAGFDLLVLPISTGFAGILTLTMEKISEINMIEQKEKKKTKLRAHNKLINLRIKFSGKCLEEILIDEKEDDPLYCYKRHE